MKILTKIILSIATILGVITLPISSDSYAATCGDGTAAGEAQCSINAGETGSTTSSTTNKNTIYDTVGTVISVMLFIVGIICVIMIIWGGINYVTSSGASDQTKRARDTIVYALVGLVVAMVSWALVNWVFTSIGDTPDRYKDSKTCTNAGHTWDSKSKKCK